MRGGWGGGWGGGCDGGWGGGCDGGWGGSGAAAAAAGGGDSPNNPCSRHLLRRTTRRGHRCEGDARKTKDTATERSPCGAYTVDPVPTHDHDFFIKVFFFKNTEKPQTNSTSP